MPGSPKISQTYREVRTESRGCCDLRRNFRGRSEESRTAEGGHRHGRARGPAFFVFGRNRDGTFCSCRSCRCPVRDYRWFECTREPKIRRIRNDRTPCRSRCRALGNASSCRGRRGDQGGSGGQGSARGRLRLTAHALRAQPRADGGAGEVPRARAGLGALPDFGRAGAAGVARVSGDRRPAVVGVGRLPVASRSRPRRRRIRTAVGGGRLRRISSRRGLFWSIRATTDIRSPVASRS